MDDWDYCMGNVVKPRRASLWLEGLRLFRSHWREWSKWAAWFFVVMAACAALAYDPSSQEVIDKINAAKAAKRQLTPEEISAFTHMMIHTFVSAIPFVIVIVAQSYAYIVFFMRRQQPVIGTPALSTSRFFFWIWKSLQMFLIIFAAMFVLVGVPAGFGVALAKTHLVVVPVAVILGLIGLGFVVLVSFRLALVPTLAVCAMVPVLKTSWRMMKENCWRLFGNGILLSLVLLILWVVAMIVERAIAEILFVGVQSLSPSLAPETASPPQSFLARFFVPSKEPIHVYIRIVFNFLNLCVMTGFIRAFYCAAVRVLYEEQRLTATPTD